MNLNRKIFITLFSLMFSFTMFAQTLGVPATTESPSKAISFGYLSYDQALKGMKAYAAAQEKLQEQRAAYEAEAKRVEDEFNQKYESFLEGQNEFPRTILLKRQNELKELMQRNMEFNAQARRDLQTAEEEALKPIRAKLNETLASIAREFGFALIINIDSNACPYIDPVMGKDIQEMVAEYLKKR